LFASKTHRRRQFRARARVKSRRAPKIAKKFANTCQHFLCQNAVFMRQATKARNRLIYQYLCGFRVLL